jgi:hypothetical protein
VRRRGKVCDTGRKLCDAGSKCATLGTETAKTSIVSFNTFFIFAWGRRSSTAAWRGDSRSLTRGSGLAWGQPVVKLRPCSYLRREVVCWEHSSRGLIGALVSSKLRSYTSRSKMDALVSAATIPCNDSYKLPMTRACAGPGRARAGRGKAIRNVYHSDRQLPPGHDPGADSGEAPDVQVPRAIDVTSPSHAMTTRVTTLAFCDRL